MKTVIEVDVFDDPKYCESLTEECNFLYAWECHLFSSMYLVYDNRKTLHIKCKECERLYKEQINYIERPK